MDLRRCRKRYVGRRQQVVLNEMSGRRMGRSRRARHLGLLRMKVRRLQRIVPGGRGLQADLLFLHTADYILRLRFQVHVLQALSKVFIPS
ncbi:hypothetical protein NE237_007795 [Protea cynaroides]|uniref:Uncharacterized protein n=1 Tax=Protea cynaroides TaxID=273540 RepID=A0A9Q0KQ34_9MAGN|nr:hypothetical protein NE237_007795 [Protea cynaroides]